MKNILSVICFLLICLSLLGQKDRLRLCYDTQCGIMPMKLYGTVDVGEVNPDYDYKEINGLSSVFGAHMGINIPFIKKENWSIGTKLSAGFGLIIGLHNADGMTLYQFEFPEYLYFCKNKGFKYSAFIGYKFSWSALPFSYVIIGGEIPLGSKISISIYGSPFSYKYWYEYTNGTYHPALKVREFGFTFRRYLGRE